MPKLSDILIRWGKVILSGPYGTEIAERVALDIVERPQRASGVSNNKYIGAGCSALLNEDGWPYVKDVALDNLKSVPEDQAVILVTNSFRLAKQNLESAASVRDANPQLPAMGLELCLDSIRLAEEAIYISERSRDNTLLAMSVGTPFDCYKGEDTPDDIENKYLPQTFAAVRFGHPLDYLMFETVPSLKAAIGAARAFKQAHEELSVKESLASFKNSGTIVYMGNILSFAERIGGNASHDLVPSYDPKTKTFQEIEPEKEYVISFCLEEDGTLNGIPLREAMSTLYDTIENEGLYVPVGAGINCNSPEVTGKALSQLYAEELTRVIGIHPNASSENNPRQYAHMTKQQAIPTSEFVTQVTQLSAIYGLTIVGGCCGTNHTTMEKMSQMLL
ncbi:MAG: homocysteine S-methyltransferase family protein [Nanoarchaeota archaeon]|nr:homocysteine S-methyltransferase family protein [Nanoarchaeota archaeon]